MDGLPLWLVQGAAVLGAIVGLLAFAKGVIEYSKQNALRRAEHFGDLRKSLKDNETFRTICEWLDTDDARLAAMPFKDKRDFLGYFEEVALSVNSGLLRPSVAHYMFGYYALRCDDNHHFWAGINKDGAYWFLFRDFAARMRQFELSDFDKNTRRLRF